MWILQFREMDIRDLQKQISQLAESTIDNFSKQVQVVISFALPTSFDATLDTFQWIQHYLIWSFCEPDR